MSLYARLAVIFGVGFVIQCIGGVSVAAGHLGGLTGSVSGSIFMGFALGVWRTNESVRRELG